MKLNAIETIQNGIQLGLKSFPALLVNGILFVLTVWIPYLNVGTLIGMINLPARMARDEGLSMTEIFDPKYRQHFGEVFLTLGLVGMGVLFASMLLVGPILQIAWSLAVLLVIDKGMEPLAAIRKSSDLTYGNKWAIFFAYFLFMIGAYIVILLLAWIGSKIAAFLAGLLVFAVVLLIFPIILGINAEIYKKLTSNG
ncbi:MAG: hypothetical protein KDK37_10020 [Leptospiraceae bacterium]|nr:hypothetical protein [Leptospiraceae bacterium]MCB1304606.1 hypothetical protein [Leptospiraceae bacterium]